MADPVAPFSVKPTTPISSGFRFPGIPNPGETESQLKATVYALKEAVELLTGQRGDNRALVKADLGNSLPTPGPPGPGGVTPIPNNGGYGLLDYALTQFNHIFTHELVEINAIIDNEIADVIAGYQAGDASIAGTVSTLSIQTASNATAITNEAFVRATADSAFAVTLSSVSAVAGGKNKVFVGVDPPVATAVGDIWIDTLHNNLLKTWDGTQWLARQDGAIAANASAISTETAARVNADSAIATQITNLTTTVNGNTASITNEIAARTTADTSLAASITTLQTNLGTTNANLTTETAARVSGDSALSGQVTTANAAIGNVNASGNYRLLTVASPFDGAAAEFAVQLRASSAGAFTNAGMRLQVLSNGSSRFVVDAAQFIVNVANGPKIPFIIQGSDMVWGGTLHASSIYAGEITAAHIQAGSITADRLTANTLTATQIQARSIDAGRLQVGTLTATEIGAGVITADKLVAGTITAASGVIGNLAVDTLQVAGSAITAPVVGIGGGFSGNGVAVVANLVSASFVGVAGSTINVLITFTYSAGYGGAATSRIQLFFNGGLVHDTSIQNQQNLCVVTTTVAMTATGGVDTATVQANWVGQNGNISLQTSTLSVVPFKR